MAHWKVYTYMDSFQANRSFIYLSLDSSLVFNCLYEVQFCKKHLAFYKVPSKVVFRKDLPKSLIGKVLRRMLTLDEKVESAKA